MCADATGSLISCAVATEEKHAGSPLGDVLDRFGSGSIGLGVAEPDWFRKRKALSPRYSTERADLAVGKPAELLGVAVQPKSCFGQDSPFRAEVRHARRTGATLSLAADPSWQIASENLVRLHRRQGQRLIADFLFHDKEGSLDDD